MPSNIFLFGNIDEQGQVQAKSGNFTAKARKDREGRDQSAGYYSVTYGNSYSFQHPPTVVATCVSNEIWATRNATIYNSGLDGFDLFIKSNSGGKKESAWNFIAIYVSEESPSSH